MNKSKIEWCDMTWNPVTGCLHGCEYCYARKIARRFCSNEHGKHGLLAPCDGNCKACSQMDGFEFLSSTRRWNHTPSAAYPYGFMPTFHPHRLNEPAKLKKPQRIFVCSMADLFGEWVPDEWIAEVFRACEAAPWHKYMFLTKNPGQLPLSSFIYSSIFDKHSDFYWFGMTVTDQKSLEKGYTHFTNIRGNTFLSIEPLHEPIALSRIDTGNVIYDMAEGMGYYVGGGQKVQRPSWIIVGAESGNRKGKIIPKREWIQDIVDQCRDAGVPVFMKNSLAEVWGGPLIQEWPQGLKGEA